MEVLNKNEIYEAEITGLTSEAQGVCRIAGRAVFVPGALPGERWRVKIVKVSSSTVYARGEEALSLSPSRAESLCENFGRCGGCDFMHMTYEAELQAKLARVNDAFRRIGKLSLEAEEIIGSDSIYSYRNKAIYNISDSGGEPVCGFFRPRSHEVVPVTRCLLQSDAADRAAHAVCRWMRSQSIPAGLIRHVFTRVSRRGEAVCCVVASGEPGERVSSLVKELRGACPELTGIVLNVNRSDGNTVLAGEFITLWGVAEMRDTLCGFEFSIAPRAFYQINPPQAEKLYALAVDYAGRGGTMLDLYCGAGTISLCLSRVAGRVIGAEVVPEAIENARANAERNGVTNAEFICADAGDAALELKGRGVVPSAVVVDPPRRGMSEAAVRAVASMSPERIVYVSCDPATLARDLKLFSSLGYTAETAAAVDMFPRTANVESVVLMTRSER